MTIDTEHPMAYEMLSMVIDEFEEQAISTQKRQALLAVSNGPMTGMELALEGSERALRTTQQTRDSMSGQKNNVVGQGDGERKKKSFREMLENSNVNIDVEADADLIELMNLDNNGAVRDWLAECAGCDLRLQFDWQLKPFALLGPINAFLDSIQDAIDRLKARMDPLRLLDDLCNLLNALKGFCLADLIAILMALKMLIKRYVLQLFSIRIDWTVLLGPLLKFIVEGIATLLEQITGIILAPIDCALAVLYTSNDLLKAGAELVNSVAGIASLPGAGIESGIEADGLHKDHQWITSDSQIPGLSQPFKTDQPEAPDPGFLRSTERTSGESQASSSVSVPIGFALKSDISLEEALADPLFTTDSTFLEKVIVPVQDARNWISELFHNIIDAIRSLGGLVGGGLALSLDNIGIILFLLDVIALVTAIIKLIQKSPDVKDWCTEIQRDPAIVESVIKSVYGNDLTAEAEGTNSGTSRTEGQDIILKRGPDIVGTIKTCSSHRGDAESQAVARWIQDLDAKGAV